MLPHTLRPIAPSLRSGGGLLVLLTACAPADPPQDGGHGHDHGAGGHSHGGHAGDDHAHDDGHAHQARSVFGPELHAFVEFPVLVAGTAAHFDVHLTDARSGRAVTEGSLTLELIGAGGAPLTMSSAGPARPGLFVLEGQLGASELTSGRLTHRRGDRSTQVELGPLGVYPDLARGEAAAEAEQQPEPAGAVAMLLEQQWSIGLRSELVARGDLSERLQVPGVVEVPFEARAAVSAPVSGELLAVDGAALPRLGEAVAAGQVVAHVRPPLEVGDRAALAANEASRRALQVELDARALELEQRRLEAERVRSAAQTRREFAGATLARVEELRAAELGTVASVEQAREALALAESDLSAAQAQLDSVGAAGQDLERQRREVIAGPGSTADGRFDVVAPIDGEVLDRHHVLGEAVGAGTALFHLANLERLWLTAHVSEFDLPRIEAEPTILVQLAGESAWIDATAELGARLVHVGASVDPEARTVPLRFEVRNPDRRLRAGMFVDLWLSTGSAAQVVAIPRSAIAREGGRPVAFVALGGETFERRFLELGLSDGEWVEVRSGLGEGERIVVAGAQAVRLAGAASGEFGHGHVH